eukprot:11227854-Lingulodinium_polyedra.AAC.1
MPGLETPRTTSNPAEVLRRSFHACAGSSLRDAGVQVQRAMPRPRAGRTTRAAWSESRSCHAKCTAH